MALSDALFEKGFTPGDLTHLRQSPVRTIVTATHTRKTCNRRWTPLTEK